MFIKLKLFFYFFIINFYVRNNGCTARSLENNNQEKECDLLLKRIKRDTESNFIEDDDAFIENLIKSTLNKEKQKCIDKYHLLEMPRHVQQEDADEAKELRREVAKLKDLVNVIKDQRYILRNLETTTNGIHSKSDDSQETKHQELEHLREEMQKLHNQLSHAESDVPKNDPVQAKLDKQQIEITNLKNLLQGLLIEMKSTRTQGTTTEAPNSFRDKDMQIMMKELLLLEKKLSDLQPNSKKSTGTSEVVGMRPPLSQDPNQNTSILSQRQSPKIEGKNRSAPSSERASEDELDALLNLLAPEKSTSSIASLLKSLDADSDDEIERRIQSLEKQVKQKRKQALEDKLKSLERQLTSGSSKAIESKSGDSDIGGNAQLKQLLVDLIKKKNQQSESKSLDDDRVLDELRALQKSIKSLSTDDDDLFEDLEEKNGNLDVTLEKLINAGGSTSGTSHRRRKLTQGQIRALRRRIMAMKQGNLGGGGSAIADFGTSDGGSPIADEENLYGPSHGHGYGSGDDFIPHWQIAPGGSGHNYGPGISINPGEGFYGGGSYIPEGFSQYGHGGKGSYGPNKYTNFGNSENFYGNPGGYSNIATNQFGTPLYSTFGNYPTTFQTYSGYQGTGGGFPYSSGSYSPSASSKYLNGNADYANIGPAALPGNPLPYQNGDVNNYKQFFPAAQEAPGSSYIAQQNSGTAGPSQSYQNQPGASYTSVGDLKSQIYDLQGVINTFNRPEYIQKPEDKAIVYNLNKQINELKGVVNTLQETPYNADAGNHQHPNVHHEQHAEYAQPPLVPIPAPVPGAPIQIPENHGYAPEQDHGEHLPGLPQPQGVYPPPQGHQPEPQPHPEYQNPQAPRSYQQSYRKRRAIVQQSAVNHHNEEAIDTLSALIGGFFDLYGDNLIGDSKSRSTITESLVDPPLVQHETVPEVPQMFEDINAKIADVRKQLDRQIQQRQILRRPMTTPIVLPQVPQQFRPFQIPKLPKSPKTRSNVDYDNFGYNYANNYGGYENNYNLDFEKNTKLFKVKKDDKKADILDKIFDKILDKVISKLEKAFPKILEVIFGKFEFSKDYYSIDNSYGDNYGAETYYNGEDHNLEKSFSGMGLIGLLPMIIVKFLSKIHYFFKYLQKYKFFKSFLIPAGILLLVAGAVIFLVWWLQPNDDYKQISYEPYQQSPAYRSAQPEKTQRNEQSTQKFDQYQAVNNLNQNYLRNNY